MKKFDSYQQQEKAYDKLVDGSFKCKSLEDVNKLLLIFKAYKWNDTNRGMLEWILNSRAKFFKERDGMVKKEQKIAIARDLRHSVRNMTNVN